jgi:hypothetical protein
VDPRAGLDDVEKLTFLALLGLEIRSFGRVSRSQSLYRTKDIFHTLSEEVPKGREMI